MNNSKWTWTRTMVVLGGGVEAVPIIRRVGALGYRTAVVDMDPDAPGFGAADERVLASCYHGKVAANVLREQRIMPEGVMCAAVDAPLAAAVVRRAFDLPGLRPDAAMMSQNKAWQKAALREAGLPVPEFALIRRGALEGGYLATREELKRTLEGASRDDEFMVRQINAGAPLVIIPDGRLVAKPEDSRGGRGVVRLLPGAPTESATRWAAQYSSSGNIILEQWLDGPQLSTESIVVGGRALFTAVALRNYARLDEFAPFCVEDGADMPYGDGALAAECSALVERACRALGWDNLTVKGDLVVHAGRVKIIELAARLSGGFFSSHYIPLAYGMDFVGAAVRLAMGEEGLQLPTSNLQPPTYVCQRYVFLRPEDIGRAVESVRETNAEWPPTAVFASWNVKAGDTVRPVTSHPDRLGQAIAVGGTAEEARAKAERAVEEMYAGIKIVVG